MFIPRRFWSHTYISKQIFTYSYATTSDNPKLHEHTCWNSSIAEAEKVIGYPTSFLNLRWLLNDEVANIALHLRKLLGTNHPLLSVAKDLILNDEKPSWGLIVLLVSKAGGQTDNFSLVDKDVTTGILHSQRHLAEVTEMIRTSHLLHKGLTVIHPNTKNAFNMNFGNKLALLFGDYFLSSSYTQLAKLQNHDLNKLMSSALRDLTESEFIGPRNKHNKPLPAIPKLQKEDIKIDNIFDTAPANPANILGIAKAEWTLRNILGGASLLGKACQGALMLSGHNEDFQRHGYVFGKNFALSLMVTQDYNCVFNNGELNPVSAPVLFHLQHYPSFYFEFEKLIDNLGDINYARLRNELRNSPAIDDTKKLQQELCEMTLDLLNKFKDCDAKQALRNILYSIHL